jgi:hypothetical protein
MYRKYGIVILVAILAFALGLVPVLAQADWSVYLYNGMSKELLRISPDGAQTSHSLGLDENTYVSSYDMAFTNDGTRVAFCAVTYPPSNDPNNPAQPTAHLYLRDIAAGTNQVDVDLGNAIGCRTGHEAFNDDGTQLAVSRINYYPGDPAADASVPTWQLLVVDVNGGATVNELNSNSLAVSDFESLAKGGVLPYVQSFSGNQLTFAEVPYGIGGGAEWNAYTWDTSVNALTPVEHWGNFTLDRLSSTGEMVWVTADANLPGGQPFGEMPANNVVQATDVSGEVKTIYHSPDWLVVDANFINGGQGVAIQLLSPIDPNAPDQLPSIKWVTLDRTGQLTDLIESNGNPVVESAPNGYVVLNQTITDPATGASSFGLTHNANGQSTDLWSASSDTGFWELAWVSPTAPADGLQPFTAVSG